MSDRVPLFAVVVLMIGLALVPAYVWIFAIEPHREARLAAAEKELAEVDRDVEMARAAQRKSAHFHQEFADLLREREKLTGILPLPSDSDVMPDRLFIIASQNHVQMQITRIADATDRAWIEHRVQLEVSGSLKNVAAFVTRLETQSRAIAARRIELTHDGATWRAVAVVAIPYERPDAAISATTSSARTGRAK